MWNYSKINGPHVGTCFTINRSKEVKPFDFSVYFFLSKSQNVRLQLHNPGDEFWSYLEMFPVEIPTYLLPLKTSPVIKFLDIRIKDTVLISKHTFERPCNEGESKESYATCLKSKVIEKLVQHNNLSCSTWVSDVLLDLPLPECDSLEKFKNVSYTIQSGFISMLPSQRTSGCYFPCQQTSFTASLTFGIENINFYLKICIINFK